RSRSARWRQPGSTPAPPRRAPAKASAPGRADPASAALESDSSCQPRNDGRIARAAHGTGGGSAMRSDVVGLVIGQIDLLCVEHEVAAGGVLLGLHHLELRIAQPL